MKPRLRPHPRYRGWWMCGFDYPVNVCIADNSKTAMDLWLWRQIRQEVREEREAEAKQWAGRYA